MFYDERFGERSAQFRNVWIDECRRMPRAGHDEGRVALWHRRDRPVVDETAFGGQRTMCAVDHHLWNGRNIQAPIMYFGDSSSLGSLSETSGRTTLSFPLSDRPFSKHFSLDRQSYVLSIDPGIGLFRNEQATFHLPFLPALNEFYGRNCHFEWDSARAEPDSLGIIATAGDTDMSLRAVDVGQLVAEVFATVGIQAKPSDAGRVGSALIRQMGGLDDCRAFRIDGVRHLIASHSPEQAFTRNVAKQMINRGVDRRLADYQRLYIEPRPSGASLIDDDVFRHLLEKGVFRAGLEFQCPNCVLSFWSSLDDAKSQLECEYCGHRFAVANQLPKKDWAFRRSGLFGRNDHQKGGIPVALALQQLVKLNSFGHPVFSTGMNLESRTAAIRPCETDFVVISQRGRDQRIQLVIGEVKSRRDRITADDVAKLSAVADAFPSDEFDVFLCFARITPFEADEVQLIRRVNEGHRTRAIMLTARELEPYFIYERTAQEFDIDSIAVSFEDLACTTDRVFFQNLVRQPRTPRKGEDA